MYGLTETTSANGMKLYILGIRTTMHAGFFVFSDEATRAAYLDREKIIMNELNQSFIYDPGYIFPAACMEEYHNAASLFSRVSNRQLYIAYQGATQAARKAA